MRLIYLRIIALMSVAAIASLLWFVFILFSPNRLEQPVRISIDVGLGINEISRSLDESKAIKNTFVFETYIWFLRREGRVQAGIYEIPKGASIHSVTRQITMGEVAEKEVSMTFIEGWTINDIAKEVAKKTSITKEDFLTASQQVKNGDYGFLGSRRDETNLEGYLFPDTYRVFRTATAEEILQKTLKNFDRKFSLDLRSAAQSQSRTIDQNVIMASILEREVKSLEDKRSAAAVFWKRLDIGMPLQSDATINFLTKKKNDRATREDLDIDSPYNTYRYLGLPPSPISNPGLDSLTAAANPSSNEYYYFLTKESGEAVFAKTIEEHNFNKALYLK